MSVPAHFFVVVCGSLFHERLVHFFVDIYSWFQQYDNYNHKLNSLSFSDYTLQDQLGEIQAAYLDNHLITAEECTKQMQERAEIYLNE